MNNFGKLVDSAIHLSYNRPQVNLEPLSANTAIRNFAYLVYSVHLKTKYIFLEKNVNFMVFLAVEVSGSDIE